MTRYRTRPRRRSDSVGRRDWPSRGAGGGSASCTEGDTCDRNGSDGLCRDGVCAACTDPDDDDACQDAYGAGRLCLDGDCTAGECRNADDCGGASCEDNACSSCDADSDCASDAVCDTGTGLCVSPAQCQGVAVGGECPVNPNDICCGAVAADRVCTEGECCSDAECESEPGTVCLAGQCVDETCDARLAYRLYVDSTAAAPGEGWGSESCPLGSLTNALDLIRATGENEDQVVLITVSGNLGTETEDGNFPLEVPSNVIIMGVGEPRPVITAPANTSAFLLVDVNAARLENLDLVQQGEEPGEQGAGVSMEGSSDIRVQELDIRNFNNGLRAAEGTTLRVGQGTISHDNRTGLRVASGGNAQVYIGEGQPQVRFEYNTNGILVVGEDSVIDLGGFPDPAVLEDGDAQSVRVNDNTEIGIELPDLAYASIFAVDVSNNGSHGLAMTRGTLVVMVSSLFRSNGGHGIYIGPSEEESNLLIGSDSSPARPNTFTDHAQADICVDDVLESNLNLPGNVFGDFVCWDTDASGQLNSGTCTADVNIGIGFDGSLGSKAFIVLDDCTLL